MELLVSEQRVQRKKVDRNVTRFKISVLFDVIPHVSFDGNNSCFPIKCLHLHFFTSKFHYTLLNFYCTRTLYFFGKFLFYFFHYLSGSCNRIVKFSVGKWLNVCNKILKTIKKVVFE